MIPLRFSGFTIFQPTRPLRGATGGQGGILSLSPYFNPRAPCGARPEVNPLVAGLGFISTHAPLAGRDFLWDTCHGRSRNFNPRAPCGARRITNIKPKSTNNFNPRAPCGARPIPSWEWVFLKFLFQPTRPLRGATGLELCRLVHTLISTHAPLAGRDTSSVNNTLRSLIFQPTRPLRGATRHVTTTRCRTRDFNPRAPCGARLETFRRYIAEIPHFNPRAPCGARQGAE